MASLRVDLLEDELRPADALDHGGALEALDLLEVLPAPLHDALLHVLLDRGTR